MLKLDNEPASLSKLKKMTDALIHRGPDGEGHWICNNQTVGFGHRRLSIIDLSDNGKQPMHYLERYTITFNGEIYNYLELKNELLIRGYKFKSHSDTEVLLALYDLKKETLLSDIDGMFAFAIWDEKEQILFCARDRFGEKPFYYSLTEGKYFYFASEMKALWSVGISKTNDEDVVDNYIKTSQVTYEKDSTRTFYKDIKQLDASHYMIIKNGGQPKIKRYYDIDTLYKDYKISIDDAQEKFLMLFKESILMRMRSDVAVGSSLSGGLDSSSIVAIINLLKGKEALQKTFSARFSDYEKDEGKHISKVINACGNIDNCEVFPNATNMINEFSKIVYHQEEPFASSSIYAQWKVMELAKQNDVVVLLDGQGADEYLAGYLPYYKVYLNQLFFTDKAGYKNEITAYNKLRQVKTLRYEEQETLRMKVGRLLRKTLKKPMPYNSLSLSVELKRSTLSFGLKELLRYADRNSMAHSREIRLPFLSYKMVDFVFSLPDNYKLSNGWTKYLLRKAMNDILPEDICWRIDKIGYEPPQKEWLAEKEYWISQIEQGEKKFEQIKSLNGISKSAWDYIMINNYVTL